MCSLPLREKTMGLLVACQHPTLQLFQSLQVCASVTHLRDATCNIGAGHLDFPSEGSYPGTEMGEYVLSLIYDNGIIIIIK